MVRRQDQNVAGGQQVVAFLAIQPGVHHHIGPDFGGTPPQFLDPSVPGEHDAGCCPRRSRQRLISVQELERSLGVIDAAEKEKLHAVATAPIGHRARWGRGVGHDPDAVAAQPKLSNVELLPLRGQHHETVRATEDPGNPVLKWFRQVREEVIEAAAVGVQDEPAGCPQHHQGDDALTECASTRGEVHVKDARALVAENAVDAPECGTKDPHAAQNAAVFHGRNVLHLDVTGDGVNDQSLDGRDAAADRQSRTHMDDLGNIR